MIRDQETLNLLKDSIARFVHEVLSRIDEGTSQIQQLVIARNMIRRAQS